MKEPSIREMDLDVADCCAHVFGHGDPGTVVVLAPTCKSLGVITRYKCTGSAVVRVCGQFMDAVAGPVLSGCLWLPSHCCKKGSTVHTTQSVVSLGG